MNKVILILSMAISVIGFSIPAAAASLVVNGDFETGNLNGWTQSGINAGFATVVQEGTCFSSTETKGVTLNGNFAANVRSSGPAPTNSIGILTSDPFVAGTSVEFQALSEKLLNPDTGGTNSVTLEVRLLDSGSNVLLSQIVQTNIVGLYNFCNNAPIIDGIFSTHTIDISAFTGQTVKLQFRQHTNAQGYGFFTLIDDVKVEGVPENTIGGKILPIEYTSLLLAGAQSTTWLIPVVLSIVGMGLFVVSRKSKNQV